MAFPLRKVLVAVLLSACGGPPPAASPATPSTAAAAPEVATAHRAPSAWPAGLVPCAKDAPAGEGCGKGASPGASGASGASGAPGAAIGTAAARPAKDEDTVWKVPVGPDDPVQGPADALVTLVVFSDFECPFCKRAADTFKRLFDAYPAGDLRLVWKDMPLPMHERAEPAAQLARVARAQNQDAGFWAAHDLIYAAQPDLSDASLRRIAEKLDLKWSDVRAAIRGARFGAVIRADVALSDVTDVRAAPTTFVNGRQISGAQPYDKLHAVIDAELKKARSRVAAGVPRARLYATTIEHGHQIAPPSDAPAP